VTTELRYALAESGSARAPPALASIRAGEFVGRRLSHSGAIARSSATWAGFEPFESRAAIANTLRTQFQHKRPGSRHEAASRGGRAGSGSAKGSEADDRTGRWRPEDGDRGRSGRRAPRASRAHSSKATAPRAGCRLARASCDHRRPVARLIQQSDSPSGRPGAPAGAERLLAGAPRQWHPMQQAGLPA